MTDLFFEHDDLDETELPAGFYPSTITGARLRISTSGNRMIHVVHALDDVAAPHARLADYFVLEGAAPHVLTLTRRRLVLLYRAARIEPHEGAAITPEELLGAQLDVRVEHDRWQGRPRLRVVEYRSRSPRKDSIPF